MGWSTITGIGGVERLTGCSKLPLYMKICLFPSKSLIISPKRCAVQGSHGLERKVDFC